MKFTINGITIDFPYQFIYPEQFQFIKHVTSGVLNKDVKNHHIVIEMGTGTGKTIASLSASKALLEADGSGIDRIIYCTRTIDEMQQVFKEVEKFKISSVALASRVHLCLLDDVKGSPHASAKCKIKRENKECKYYHEIEDDIPNVASIEELNRFGKEHERCPYFMARKNFSKKKLTVCTYNYIIDPRVENVTIRKLDNLHKTLLIFDEAHNLDTSICDALSMTLSIETVENATISLARLTNLIARKQTEELLNDEYEKLVKGLKRNEISDEMGEPFFTDNKTIPGSFRRAHDFLKILKLVVNFFRSKLHDTKARRDVKDIVVALLDTVNIPQEVIEFLPARLHLLLKTLGDEGGQNGDKFGEHLYYDSLLLLTEFAAMLCRVGDGFSYIPDTVKIDDEPHHVLHLACVDSALAMKPLLTRYHSMIFTSGTLSPLDTFSRLTGITNPVIKESIAPPLDNVLRRTCPIFVTKGFDRVAITSQFSARIDTLILKSYGKIVTELSKVVPDGLLCFFPSYSYMNLCIANWEEYSMLKQISNNKLIFIESKYSHETSIAFENYRLACHVGRGAILFAVARGRLSEGIDFSKHLARCVLIIGAPYLNTLPKMIQERVDYMDKKKIIQKEDFFVFDAMRAANQCVGRCIRGKDDYSVVIYADKRFKYTDEKVKNAMPQWIMDALDKKNTDMSADQCVTMAREFLMQMSSNFDCDIATDEMIGKTLWRCEDVKKEISKGTDQ
ncbi:DNA repair helicase rad3/xp-D [Entamoeba marina]